MNYLKEYDSRIDAERNDFTQAKITFVDVELDMIVDRDSVKPVNKKDSADSNAEIKKSMRRLAKNGNRS